ncbi:MAG: hypothetical protein WEC75_07975 [Dehalococcoidia bacterium]
MTSAARTVLPTDLVALVSYDGRVYSNEAMTRDRIGTEGSPHPLEAAFEQWFSFATGRHTWISVKGPTLRGLVSARKRGSKLAWEVDCLINAAADDSNGVLMGLLDQMTQAAGRSGALRIFLRLPRDSATERAAQRCSFVPYLRERVYRRPVDASALPSLPAGLRRRAKSDGYPLFQLYNAVTPEQVRRFEGGTLTEWSAVQEHLGRATQYVLEGEGRVRGWLRVASDGDIGRFDVVAEAEALDPVIDAAMVKLAGRAWNYALVPEHEGALRLRLEERGFEAEEEYVVLARRTVHTVKAPKAVPVLAHPTLG